MSEIIAEARNLVHEYSRHIIAQDLDSLLGILCEDVHFEIQYVPHLDGKDNIRAFLEEAFAKGSYQLQLSITEEKSISDVVFINGEIHRTFVTTNGNDDIKTFLYSIILKKEDDQLKIWQGRFAS